MTKRTKSRIVGQKKPRCGFGKLCLHVSQTTRNSSSLLEIKHSRMNQQLVWANNPYESTARSQLTHIESTVRMRQQPIWGQQLVAN